MGRLCSKQVGAVTRVGVGVGATSFSASVFAGRGPSLAWGVEGVPFGDVFVVIVVVVLLVVVVAVAFLVAAVGAAI